MTTSSLTQVSRHELMAVSESDVRAVCGERFFAEAEAIVRRGGVASPTRQGLELRASISDERRWLVSVRVTFAVSAVQVRCNCRYPEQFCMHVGAVLLLWARSPGHFAVEGPDTAEYAIQRQWPTRGKEDRPVAAAPDALAELRSSLGAMLVPQLRDLARRVDVRLRGTAKGELVDQLAVALSDEVRLQRILGSLSADAKLALGAVFALGGDEGVGSRQLGVALKRLLPDQPMGESALGELAVRGVVFGGSDLTEPTYQVPRAYWPFLPNVEAVRRVTDPPEEAKVRAGCLVDSLLETWARVRDGELKLVPPPPVLPSFIARVYSSLQQLGHLREEVEDVVQAGRWTSAARDLTIPPRAPLLDAASLAGIAEQSGVEAAAFAWRVLVSLGLVVHGEPASATEEPARELLWSGPIARLRAALDGWIEPGGWSELDLALERNPGLRLRHRFAVEAHARYSLESSTGYEIQIALLDARLTLTRLIGLLPVGVWLEMESLLGLVWRMWPDILYGEQGRRAKPTWWLEVDGVRVDNSRLDHWMKGPGAVVTALVAGPLHWLGLADFAGPAERPTAFRLRPEARLLRGIPLPDEAAIAPIELGPGLEVRVAPGHPDAELRDLLTTAGKLVEASPRAIRYVLTPEGASRVFVAGHDAESLLSLLESRARSVPSELRETIVRWWRLYGELRLYEDLTLIELADDQILPELLAASSLRKHLIHQFSPRLLVVDPAGADELFAELHARGYMPLRESARLPSTSDAAAADPEPDGADAGAEADET